MSTSIACAKCGTMNAGWAKFCATCGNPLTTPPPQTATTSVLGAPPQPAPTPSMPPPSMPPPWYSYTPPATYLMERSTQIDRTKTGLLLLIIGVLLQPVPVIGIVGTLLILIGAILVILGRNVFGPQHSRNTIWSIIIFIVGVAIGIIGAILWVFEGIVAATNTNRTPEAVRQALFSSFDTFLAGLAIGGAVSAIAYVLFTYAIQNRNGRTILWAGYASTVATSVVIYIIVGNLVSDAVQRSIVNGIYNPGPLQNLQKQQQLLGLLNFIPAALYSAALYLVWSRIGRGELPAATPATSTSPAPPASL